IGAEAVPTGTAMFEGGVAETVVGSALVAVLEDVIGLVDFLELMLAVLVARIAIRMMLHRELAEGCLEVDLGAGPLNAQDFVVVAFGHPASRLSSIRRHSGTRFGSACYPKMRTPGVCPGVTQLGTACARAARRQADFLLFLSSSTSVNSASTTSS